MGRVKARIAISGLGERLLKKAKAIDEVARTEGVFLNPVYTGKAMAGLIELIRKGKFTPKDTVVFVHTGGLPAVFAYHQELAIHTKLSRSFS